MRKALVVGNWKMNGTQSSIDVLMHGLMAQLAGCSSGIVVCPPNVYLDQVRKLIEQTPISVGGQNLDWHDKGAFTGEVSAEMLADLGCDFVLVGHSERRTLFGETNEDVAMKRKASLSKGIIPILCVGETQAQREAGETEDVIASQLVPVFDTLGTEAMASVVIAYEPVWAIGTGITASPQQANDVHAFIRHTLAEKDLNIANNIQILYGGSVNADNAGELFGMQDIDGALVGGASLDAASFLAICQAAVLV